MTARREDYWQQYGVDDDSEIETVRERIVAQLDADEIHGLTVTATQGATHYAVVASSGSNSGGRTIDLRTVVIDLADDTVRVSDNGLWVPRDRAVADELTRTLARTTTDVGRALGEPVDGPRTGSAVDDVDADRLLDRQIVGDEYEESDDQEDGPPSEIGGLIDRLDAAGISTDDRFIRLEFGGKSPWDHDRVGQDDLYGNYGVYATADDPLVLVDVDDPDELDAELPETYAVSSPHGDERRAHHFYRVDDLDAVSEAFGKDNYVPTWGDVRAANQYVVGPGSQLDGCDKGDACDGRCDEPDGGTYDVLRDAPIETVSAEWLIDLLDADPAVTRSDESDESAAQSGPREDTTETPDESDADDEPESTVECWDCGSEIPERDAAVHASDGDRTIYVCEGGCDA